ncbi:MAG: thiamine diphosphokinase [Chloroflexi bacterium]|nr:thiamine diphosphokinase [Chloroflexota bacterium]
MQIIILADGAVGPRATLDAAWPGWAQPDATIIVADGGARHAAELGLRIDRWVGDGDSLGEAGVEALRRSGVPIERADMDKDESDTELAVAAALRLRPDELAIVGALGGFRLDHALANVGLLSLPGLAGVDTRLVAVDARVRLLAASGIDGEASSVRLAGRIGDLVTLLPFGEDALGVTTDGLRFPLVDEPLLLGRTRGLSNVRQVPIAGVRMRRGRIVIVETPATL